MYTSLFYIHLSVDYRICCIHWKKEKISFHGRMAKRYFPQLQQASFFSSSLLSSFSSPRVPNHHRHIIHIIQSLQALQSHIPLIIWIMWIMSSSKEDEEYPSLIITKIFFISLHHIILILLWSFIYVFDYLLIWRVAENKKWIICNQLWNSEQWAYSWGRARRRIFWEGSFRY